MKDTFYLPKIETRSLDVGGVITYIVRGYATTPNHIYPYKVDGNRVFKEYFSERGIKNINRNRIKTLTAQIKDLPPPLPGNTR